jgi:hypothetical protein
MAKRPGRPRKGKLADMGVYPPDEECYEPPPYEDCEEFQTTIDLAPGHRLGTRQVYRAGTAELVYFAIWQSVLVDGRWQSVARIDCSHSTVHRHQFTRDGGNHRTDLERIPVDHGVDVVDRWYGPAEAMLQNEWEDNYRRWHGDSE